MNSQYNLLPYNALQYNITESIDITISEIITSVDATIVKSTVLPKVEFILIVDDVTKSISDKVLSDNLRTNDWLEIKNGPQSDPWS